MFLFPADLIQQIEKAVKPTVQIREQYQRHFDPGFNKKAPANRVDLFSRLRPGLAADMGGGLSAQFVYQYSADYTGSASVHPTVFRSDVYKLNLQDRIGSGSLILGRQDLIKGNGRLLGDPDFGMTGRSWDLARYTISGADLFGGRLAVNPTESKYQRLAGASVDTKALGTTMLVYKHDLNAVKGSIDVFALDQLYKKSFGRLSIDAELAGEEGFTSPHKLQAWAYSGRLSYKVVDNVALYGEIDAASGGTSGNTVQTFDQLYPGNHPYYGILDVVGWRNMNDFMLGSRWNQCVHSWSTFEVHDFSLRSANDALYNDQGVATKYVDPTGKSGADVGREFDLYQHIDLSPRHAIEFGGAVFLPGKFIDNLTPKGSNPQYWLYGQYTLKF